MNPNIFDFFSAPEPRESSSLHLVNPVCTEPTTMIFDSLIIHPNAQTMISPLISRNAPVAVFSMKCDQLVQPLGPYDIVLDPALSSRIPYKTDLVKSAHFISTQTALPL